jgi:transcription initiation factor TFIIB
MASALYAACRDTETPRNLKDVEQAANIKRKDIARCYRLLIKELDLKLPVTDSVQCVARIASQIGIQEKTKRHAVRVLKTAQKNEISAGKDPMGLAAAAYTSHASKTVKIKHKEILRKQLMLQR